MKYSIRFSEKELELIKAYANQLGQSVSQVVREAILEKIEDANDMMIYDEALKAYQAHPKSYSLEATKKKLNMHTFKEKERIN